MLASILVFDLTGIFLSFLDHNGCVQLGTRVLKFLILVLVFTSLTFLSYL